MMSGRKLKWLAIAAIVFGALTVFSGGRALFGNAEARAVLGNIVPFVLWFNFMAGFAYLVAGVALLQSRPWAAKLAIVLAVATVLVILAFAAHILTGGAFEVRTVAALSFRALFWFVVARVATHAVRQTVVGSSQP